MDNAYKVLADLTKNTRVTIDTALNFINDLSGADPHRVLPEDNAEIRLKAKQIAQDLQIDNIFSKVEKAKDRTRQRKSESHTPPRERLKGSIPQSNILDVRAVGTERSRLYAEAQAKTRRLEEEIREEVIAQRAKELAERQRIRIQEEARLLVEKEREKTAKIMAEQKERYRMEALEKCAAMMARRRQVILATQILVSWKAHIKALNRNEVIIKKSYLLCLLRLTFHTWLSTFLYRKETYEKERQRLRMETMKSQMRMAETNYVVVLMKKTLLAMRVEAQRLQTRRRQEEQRACRERRIQSFIQRIEVSKSLCLSQNEINDASLRAPSPEVSCIEAPEQKQGSMSTNLETQQNQSHNDTIGHLTTSSKKVRFETTEECQTSSIDSLKPFSESNQVAVLANQVAEQPTIRKLLRKAPQVYIDYGKRAAERKQERLRRLEEDRLAKEQAEHSKKVLQEELARQKVQVRREQLEIANSCHAGLLLRIGYHSLVILYTKIASWHATSLQRMLSCSFSVWVQQTREKLGKKVEILSKMDDVIGRIMDRFTKQSVFVEGFIPLLQQSRQRFLQADHFFALTLFRRSFMSMRWCLHQADLEAQVQGKRLRQRVIGRTVIFAWRHAILDLRKERVADARQTEIYRLMRAQIAVQWEEVVDRFILESFPSFYEKFEPIVRSFDEFIDSSSLEALAETVPCHLLRSPNDSQSQLLAPHLPSLPFPVQTYSSGQQEQKDTIEDDEEVDFTSLAALISAAKQLTGQSVLTNQADLEFTYDFSIAASRPGGASEYLTDHSA
ncbi:Hypothetical protein GLP15_366 [Giardia lamblia P15]|uniref:Uncharacterized protein n=1 Tax=Giardia intestinalis (strain P15) TaxID=658858 RepID=E1F547_GIAIA|nr:Hypothetical protein GLP15_366 [Giardia lamblia P15]